MMRLDPYAHVKFARRVTPLPRLPRFLYLDKLAVFNSGQNIHSHRPVRFKTSRPLTLAASFLWHLARAMTFRACLYLGKITEKGTPLFTNFPAPFARRTFFKTAARLGTFAFTLLTPDECSEV